MLFRSLVKDEDSDTPPLKADAYAKNRSFMPSKGNRTDSKRSGKGDKKSTGGNKKKKS